MGTNYPWTLTIVASGDSLRGFPFSALRNVGEVWAINYASRDLPFATRIIAGDGRMAGYPKHVPVYCWHRRRPHHQETDIIVRQHGKGINRRKGFVGRKSHSPFCALNLAVNEGHKNILVLGCDNTGARHYYDPEDALIPMRHDRYEANLAEFAYGLLPEETVTLVGSALQIDGFSYLSMDEYLAFLKANK